jgi:hypothetical protein
MYLTWAQVIELGDVDLDFLALDELHEIGFIVKNAEAIASEHRQSPGFQLSSFRMRIELHERHDIVA